MSAPSYRWLATLLEALYGYDVPAARALLLDPAQREDARETLAPSLAAAGMPDGMLGTPEGGSLFVAVLTLRLKFPPDEARQKVERNIAMREGRA